ncbi:MAG: Ig-like domain-containing protein [Patescibacteria group bacterium]|jgi:hypothetical protein
MKNKKNLVKKMLFGLGLISSLFFVVNSVFAQVKTDYGINLGDASPEELAVSIINWGLGILALIAVIIILYGGFVWMLSGGNEEKVEKAKKILRNGIIGLVIILAAWGIATYIINRLLDATNANNGTSGGPSYTDNIHGKGNPFYVDHSNPADEEINVTLCHLIAVTFSLPVDKTTINDANFKVTVANGSNPDGDSCVSSSDCASGLCEMGDSIGTCIGDQVKGTFAFTEDPPYAAVWYPTADYIASTTYHVELSTEIVGLDEITTDTYKLEMGDTKRVFEFTTGTESDTTPPKIDVVSVKPFPEDNATEVCRNTPIQVSFSESLDPASVKDENIWLYKYTEGVTPNDPGNELSSVRFTSIGGQADDTLITSPQSVLDSYADYGISLYSGVYDAAITSVRENYLGAVRDTCGNPISGDYDDDMEGSPADDFMEATSAVTAQNSAYSYQWTFKTGEQTDCSPQIDSLTYTQPDYYSEDLSPFNNEKPDIDGDGKPDVMAGSEDTDQVTITGKYLYPFYDVGFDYNISGANLNCFDSGHNVNSSCFITNSGSSAITLRTPVAVRSGGTVSVENEFGTDSSADQFYVSSPYISSLSPQQGAVGQFVTIKGAHFINDKKGKVYFDGQEVETPCADGWDDDQIVVKIPDSFGDSFSIGALLSVQVVTVGPDGVWNSGAYGTDDKYSNKRGFTLKDGSPGPGLCSVDPSCSNDGTEDVALNGINFGTTSESVYFINSSDVGQTASINSWTDTDILTDQSPVTAQNNYDAFVSIKDADGESIFSNGMSYDIPCGEAPSVFTYGSCDLTSDVYYLPNPRPSTEEACINGVVYFAFTAGMDDASVKNNVKVYNYGTGDWNANLATASEVAGSIDSEGKLSKIYLGGSADEDSDYELFSFTPPSSQQFASDTWYKVTIPVSVVSDTGIAITEPYEWHFKVRSGTENCSVDEVDVRPSFTRATTYVSTAACPEENYTYDSKNYNYKAQPYNDGCFALRNDFSWHWAIDNNTNTNIIKFKDNSIDKITDNGYNSVCMQGNGSTNFGTAYVNANPTADATVEDEATFEVDFGYCTSDANCVTTECPNSTCDLTTSHCTPEVTSFSPSESGKVGPGGCVTLYGCYFGPTKGTSGKVVFNSDNVDTEAEYLNEALCSDATWYDDQIIAELPTSLAQNEYTILLTSYNNLLAPAVSEFLTKADKTPCLCRADPDNGSEGTGVTLYGKFFDQLVGAQYSVFYNNVYTAEISPTALDNATYGDDAYSVSTSVPTGAISSDTDGVRLEDESNGVSNSLGFEVTCDINSDCATSCCHDGLCQAESVCNACVDNKDCSYGSCQSACTNGMCVPYISSISPGYGNVGQPVTIHGCHFGSYYDKSNTLYSKVLFDETIEAPLACEGSDSWNNEEIKVYAPEGIFATETEDTATVSVQQVYRPSTTAALASQQSLSGQSYCLDSTCTDAGKDTCEADELDGGCASAWQSTTFGKSDACVGVDIPVICDLNAANGKVGDTVNIEGYNYYASDSVSFCQCEGEKDETCRIDVGSPSCDINYTYTCYADPDDTNTACSTTLSTNNGSNYWVEKDDEGTVINKCLCVNPDDANETCYINDGAKSCTYPYNDKCFVDSGNETIECDADSSTYKTLNGNVEYSINQQADWLYHPDTGYIHSPYLDYLKTTVPDGTETGNVYVQAVKADLTVCESNGANYDITCAECSECSTNKMCDLSYSDDGDYGVCTSNIVGFCADYPDSCCGNTGCKESYEECSLDETCDVDAGCACTATSGATCTVAKDEISCSTTESDGGSCLERPLYDAATSAPDNGTDDVCPNAEITLGFDMPMTISDDTKAYSDYIKLVTKEDYNAASGNFSALAEEKCTLSLACADEAGCECTAASTKKCTVNKDETTCQATNINKLDSVEDSDFGTLLLKQSSLLETAEHDYYIVVYSNKVSNTGIVDEENGMALGCSSEQESAGLCTSTSDTLVITFTTQPGTDACGPSYVTLSASEEFTERNYYFIAAEEKQAFRATVYNDNGTSSDTTDDQAIIGIADVLDWEYTWTPKFDSLEDLDTADCPVVGIITDGSPDFVEDKNSQNLTAGNQEGDGAIGVTITGDGSTAHGWSGSATAAQPVHVLYCESDDYLYSYADSAGQNFSFAYCRGSSDDETLLPKFNAPTIKSGTETGENYYSMYLFTNNDNEDLFGIKVYSDDLDGDATKVFDAVKPSLWTSVNLDDPSSYSDTALDGYAAVENTQSTIAVAPNLSGSVLYMNAYMLSVNKGAGSEMQDVFSKIKEYWYFNTNSEFATTTGKCNLEKDKLIRDTQRITDLGTMNYLLAGSSYPALSEGTYIQYFTNSKWPSWDSALGNALGQSLPTDPVNEFADAAKNCPNDGTSTFYDETGTCWDAVNKDYKCPTDSHVYQYIYDNASSQYSLYANLEFSDDGAGWYWNNYKDTDDPCSGNSFSSGCACFNYKLSTPSTDFYHGTCDTANSTCNTDSGFKIGAYCSSDSDCTIAP